MFMAIPIRSMYGIFTYIWLIFMVNVGEYTIHGSYEIWKESHNPKELRTYNWTIVAILDPVLG